MTATATSKAKSGRGRDHRPLRVTPAVAVRAQIQAFDRAFESLLKKQTVTSQIRCVTAGFEDLPRPDRSSGRVYLTDKSPSGHPCGLLTCSFVRMFEPEPDSHHELFHYARPASRRKFLLGLCSPPSPVWGISSQDGLCATKRPARSNNVQGLVFNARLSRSVSPLRLRAAVMTRRVGQDRSTMACMAAG